MRHLLKFALLIGIVFSVFGIVYAAPSLQAADEYTLVVSYFAAGNQQEIECVSLHPETLAFDILTTGAYPLDASVPACNPIYSVLSPDGTRWLQFYDDDGSFDNLEGNRLEVRDVDGENPVTILSEVPFANSYPLLVPLWLSDSRHIIYWQNNDTDLNRYGSEGETTGDVLLIDSETQEVTTLASFPEGDVLPMTTLSPEGYSMLVAAPDRSALLFSVSQPSGSPYELYVVYTEDGRVENITNTPYSEADFPYTADWSAVDNRIAFQSATPPIATILGNNTNARSGPGTGYEVVNTFSDGTTLPILEIQEGWAKVLNEDGQEVWVSTSVIALAEGSAGIDVIDLDEETRTTVGVGFQPRWSADGRYLASLCDFGICVVDTETDEASLIESGDNYSTTSFFWSPDSQHLGIIKSPIDLSGSSALYELHLYDLNTGEDVMLLEPFEAQFTSVNDLLWSPDGQQFIFRQYPPLEGPEDSELFIYYVCDLTDCQNIEELINGASGNDIDINIINVRWLPMP